MPEITTLGSAAPGTIVASGSLITPAGDQGPVGSAGPTAVSANANNKAILGSDSLILVQGTAAGVAATTHTQTVSGDDPQLTNARAPTAHHTTHEHGGSDPVSITYSDLLAIPATFAPVAHEASHVTGSDQIPPASASTKGLLNQTSGNATDFVDGTNTCQNLVNAVQPTIWSARLRGYNAIGDPTFEVDQRNVGTGLVNPANGTFVADRWILAKNVATASVNITRLSNAFQGTVYVPGTNFAISQNMVYLKLITPQASLAAGEYYLIRQFVEGSRLRELQNDVHSISLLVSSSVAPLKFSVYLRAPAATVYSLLKLCTVTTASVWTLIPLPNLPVWPGAGGWSVTPGNAGYEFGITLAAGSNGIGSAADTWLSANVFAAPGMDNWLGQVANSTIAFAFIQHEPGALCTTPIDYPFQQNLDDCLRYFQKSYQYSDKPGTVTAVGMRSLYANGATTAAIGPLSFSKPMAKIPTLTAYNYATGAGNSVRDQGGVDHGSVTFNSPGDSGVYRIDFATATTAAFHVYTHYTADTGW